MSTSELDQEILLKVVVVGDSGVGKSNLLSRYVHNYFNEEITSTLGVDLLSKRLLIKNKSVTVQFWDTAGQERMRALANAYYRNANGIIVVYDITSKESFKNMSYWIREVKNNTEEKVKIVIIGNKTDLIGKRQVSVEEARKFADGKGFYYMEVSAKMNYENKVNECVEILTNEIVEGLSEEKLVVAQENFDMRKNNLKNVQSSRVENKIAKKSCCQYI